MLVITRRVGEGFRIGAEIELEVLGVEGDRVKIGVKAPPEVIILRRELYEAVRKENLEAAQTGCEVTKSLGREVFSSPGKGFAKGKEE